MILVTREYMEYPLNEDPYKNTEFKVFADDDVNGLQDYLDRHSGAFSFKKL